MKRPLPLSQDPALSDDLRGALRAEAHAPAPHDVAAVKQALLTKVAAATAAGVGTAAAVGGAKTMVGSALAKLAGGATAAKIVVGATVAVVSTAVVSYTVVRLGRSPEPPPAVDVPAPAPAPAPISTPVPAPVSPSVAPAAEKPLEFGPLLVELPSMRRTAEDGRRPVPRPIATPRPQAAAGAAARPAPRPVTLAEEMALYDAGRRALKAGRLDQAIEEFELYLERFGEGELRPEAGLSLVEAYVKARRPARAEAVARTLLADPSLRERRGELLRVRAEAYVQMGRCAEAKIVYAQALGAGGNGLSRELVEAALRSCVAGQGQVP